MTTPPKNRPHHTGFTLTELLIVIGIIAILIGILFPIIGRIRRAAYIADTGNEISQISNACNAYYSTYQAYPGPFSNYETQWGGGSVTGGAGAEHGTTNENGFLTLLWTYNAVNTGMPYSQINNTYFVTGAQNLVLGLMGGLRPNSTVNAVPQQVAFAAAEVGLGPMSLNPLNHSRQQPFFSTGSNYLMWCEQPAGGGPVYQSTTYNANDTVVPFTDALNNQAADAPMPVFVDRFPAPGPLPILYLRARVGAKGVISDGNIQDPSITTAGITAQYQYDIRDIVNYTNPAGVLGTSVGNTTTGYSLGAVGLQVMSATPNFHDLSAIENPTWLPASVVTAGPQNPTSGPRQTTSLPDAFAYFCNKSIAPTNTSSGAFINNTARPRAVDQFILISAGPDGIYGTTDDITSFGDVSQ